MAIRVLLSQIQSHKNSSGLKESHDVLCATSAESFVIIFLKKRKKNMKVLFNCNKIKSVLQQNNISKLLPQTLRPSDTRYQISPDECADRAFAYCI